MQPRNNADIYRSPIIVAIRNPEDLPRAIDCPHPVLFLLTGDISNVVELVRSAKEKGKDVFVHFDLVTGLGKDNHALEWLAREAQPTGIISTRSPIVSHARSLGLVTVQRTFMLDSQSMQIAVEQTRKVMPDFLEALPGIASDGVRALAQQVQCPVIAGGLIRTVDQVKAALAAGAVAISTSCKDLWDLTKLD